MSNSNSVSDHAVIRYLERVATIDIDQVRKRIHEDTKQALAAGASGIVSNGICYRFKNRKVVSVWIEHQQKAPLSWLETKQVEK